MVLDGVNNISDPLTTLFLEGYRSINTNLSPFFGEGVNMVLLAIIISLVAIFIWNFYKSLSQRDLISLNLRKYNKSTHSVFHKIWAILLFFLEYLLLMPFIIFLWFFALAIMILLIAAERSASHVLLISGAMVASIRLLSYHKNELAKDLAKLFPFITLSTFLLSARAFNPEDVILKISEIPSLLNSVFYFLFAIFIIEVILRLLYTVLDFWKSEEEAEQIRDKKK